MDRCRRCDKTRPIADFPPRRRICRRCYTAQVAECHARAGYKPPRSTLLQIRVWRLLNQLRADATSSPIFEGGWMAAGDVAPRARHDRGHQRQGRGAATIAAA